MHRTADEVVIDQPACLHKSISDAAPAKGKAPGFQPFGHTVREIAPGWYLRHRFPMILNDPAIGKLPDEAGK